MVEESKYRKAGLRVSASEAFRVIDDLLAITPRPYAFVDRGQIEDFYSRLRTWNNRVEDAAGKIFDSDAYVQQHRYASETLQQAESWEDEVKDAMVLQRMYVESLQAMKRAVNLPDPPPRFYSCFISYARVDEKFAERLYSSLVENNVSVWKDTEKLEGGKFWRAQIHESVKSYDKLILVCSRSSVQRINVVDEVISAIERERETHVQKLFPIRLDNFILSQEAVDLADGKLRAGEWREDWVRLVRAYHIPNFSEWQRQPGAYDQELKKFLDALKTPS